MNWNRIEHNLMLRSADDDRIPGVKRSREMLIRVRRHMRKLHRRRVAAARKPMLVHETAQWKEMRAALAEGRKIVSFDAEWQYQWPHKITELGVAIYQDGEIEVHNVRVRGGAGKTDKTTRFMTDVQAKKWLTGVFEGCGLLVGHAICNDRAKMDSFGWRLPDTNAVPCVDTEKWSKVMNENVNQSQKLTSFCRRHGVEVRKAHVAGNDALMTLEVALRLAAQEVSDVAA
jgi:hypothetical protein